MLKIANNNVRDRLKIVIDSEIPFTRGQFENYGDVLYRRGEEISPADVADADALLISIRTRCNASLLDGSRVRMIATANIGTDHIDMDWCRDKGIFVQNAAGCNAGGVMNYVMSALFGIASRKSISLAGATFGIIGAGSSGSLVGRTACRLGFKVLYYDPLRARLEGGTDFCSLEHLLDNSDIVSLHLPLNKETAGMADRDFFRRMKSGAFFINSARGEIVDEEALLEAAPRFGAVILDTWCGEPCINRSLIDAVAIATPHVAGYSLQSKAYASAYAVRAVARFFGLEGLTAFLPPFDDSQKAVLIDIRGKSQGEIASAIQYNYPIFTDDFLFRMSPGDFTRLRTEYRYRREFYFE